MPGPQTGINVWRVSEGGNTEIILNGHSGEVLATAFNPAGTRIVDRIGRPDSAGLGGCHRRQVSVHTQAGEAGAVAFSPEGVLVATSSGTNEIAFSIWEADTGRTVTTCVIPETGAHEIATPELVTCIAFSPTRPIATGSGTAVRIWDQVSGNVHLAYALAREKRSREFSQL